MKADGLAAGKGVVVCDDATAALALLTEWYGANTIPGGGHDVLLEELPQGREVSVFAIADGRAMVPIAAACDYKRAGDGDTGSEHRRHGRVFAAGRISRRSATTGARAHPRAGAARLARRRRRVSSACCIAA